MVEPLPEGSYTQTAYVVRDLEESAAAWTASFGAGPFYLFEVETRNIVYRGQPGHDRYRLAQGFLGATLIELIQPLDDEPSILNEVLAERGEGFHHIAPRLTGLSGESFDAARRDLEERGFELAMTNEVVHLGRSAFYDAKHVNGGFIEVFELGEGYQQVPLMWTAHVTWDGSRPLRPFTDLLAAA